MALPEHPEIVIISKVKLCEYCKSKIKYNTNKCEYCGAPIKEN